MTYSERETSSGKCPEEKIENHSYTQSQFKLLRLPGELRQQIYINLFASTRLMWGDRRFDWWKGESKTMHSAPNCLSLIYTCHQINQETRSLWLGHVLFCFENVGDLLEKFFSIPSSIITQIRHVRLHDEALELSPPGEDRGVCYGIPEALKLQPGLCLDKLTILGADDGAEAYNTLNDLIEYGNGWKELHFITRDSTMLGYVKPENILEFFSDLYRRRPQPSSWHKTLCRRDGLTSKPFVTIYRATLPNCPGAVLDPLYREVFEQSLPSRGDPEICRVEEDQSLMIEGEGGRELLVLVKRGRGVDIAERTAPPYEDYDPRRWADGMSWANIQWRETGWWEGEPISQPEFEENDRYDDVDEYEWPLNELSSFSSRTRP